MKNTLIALGLGLASSTAFANTGSINFYGQVHSGTCPIEIIDPATGNPIARVNMGNVNASQFGTVGAEAAARAFGMRITPGGNCTVTAGTANVVFTAAYGGAGTGGALYALEPGGATNLALVIKDDLGAAVANGTASKNYLISTTLPTTMIFSAAYQSTAAAVTAGTANTDVQFVVTVP